MAREISILGSLLFAKGVVYGTRDSPVSSLVSFFPQYFLFRTFSISHQTSVTAGTGTSSCFIGIFFLFFFYKKVWKQPTCLHFLCNWLKVSVLLYVCCLHKIEWTYIHERRRLSPKDSPPSPSLWGRGVVRPNRRHRREASETSSQSIRDIIAKHRRHRREASETSSRSIGDIVAKHRRKNYILPSLTGTTLYTHLRGVAPRGRWDHRQGWNPCK